MTDRIIRELARWMIASAWVFHGLVPKLLYIAADEWHLSSQFGFSNSMTYWLITVAGLAEMCFGVLFFFMYRNKWVIYINITGLLALIVMVALLDWHYLFGAFNPLTTNLPLIVLSLFLLETHYSKK